MSVSLHVRKNLGNNFSPAALGQFIKEELVGMQGEGAAMGVKIDWSRIYLTVGNDYDEYQTMAEAVARRSPYLEISVPAERIEE